MKTIVHISTHDFIDDGIRWYAIIPYDSTIHSDGYITLSDWLIQFPERYVKTIGSFRHTYVHEKLFSILYLKYEIKDF